MLRLIPKHAKIADVLALEVLIEDARDDLARARHAFGIAQGQLRAASLCLGTTEARFSSIVSIYNRLVLEYEPEKGRR